jgi:hypothetical protein
MELANKLYSASVDTASFAILNYPTLSLCKCKYSNSIEITRSVLILHFPALTALFQGQIGLIAHKFGSPKMEKGVTSDRSGKELLPQQP